MEEIEEANETVSVRKSRVLEGAADVEMQKEAVEEGDGDVDSDLEMKDVDEEFELIQLSRYWDEHIQDVIVDRDKHVDNEIAELQ